MRKLFNIFLFVLCIVAIAGCNDTESSEFKLEIKAVSKLPAEKDTYNFSQQEI